MKIYASQFSKKNILFHQNIKSKVVIAIEKYLQLKIHFNFVRSIDIIKYCT